MASISKRTSGAWQNTSYGIRATATDTIANLPATIYGDGTPLLDYLISGNTTQNGTPTPNNPIYPQGCGELENGQYKIPISSAGQTTPIYLGDVESTRQIKKLVLTGEEEYTQYGGVTGVGARITVEDMRIPSSVAQRAEGYCTHFVPTSAPSTATGDNITFGTSSNIVYITLSVASQQAFNVTTYDEFKAWIAAQYAAGTPVTVWYVLATPETGIVNEPLMKIGDYADTLSKEQAGVQIPTNNGSTTVDVDTDVKPPEVSINYHGWHMGAVHERVSGEWD